MRLLTKVFILGIGYGFVLGFIVTAVLKDFNFIK